MNRKIFLKDCAETIQSVAFSHDGKLLASGTAESRAAVWNARTGKCVALTEEQESSRWAKVEAVAFSPTGAVLATAFAGFAVKIWDLTPLKQWQAEVESTIGVVVELSCTQTLQNGATFIAFSPDGKMLVTGWNNHIFWSQPFRDGRDICVCNVKTGKEDSVLVGHEREVWCCAFSSDGKTLASGSVDATARLWTMKTGKCAHTFRHNNIDCVRAIALSQDGKTLATAARDKVRLWNVATEQCMYTYDGHFDYVRSIAFSPNGKILASGSGDGSVHFLSIRLFVNIFTTKSQIARPFATLLSIAFSPNGKTFASAGRDVTLWSLLDYPTLCRVSLFLHVGVAPYVLLDVANILTQGLLQQHIDPEFCHFENISFIVALQNRRL